MRKIPLTRTRAKEEEEQKKALENGPLTHNSKALLAKLRAKTYMIQQRNTTHEIDHLLEDVDARPISQPSQEYRPKYAQNITQSSIAHYDPDLHDCTDGGLDPMTRKKINQSRFELDEYERFLNNMYKPRYPSNILLSQLKAQVQDNLVKEEKAEQEKEALHKVQVEMEAREAQEIAAELEREKRLKARPKPMALQIVD